MSELRNKIWLSIKATYRDDHMYVEWAWWITAAAVFSLLLGGYHFVQKPTPDQLYGCTVAQQAPNGDCPNVQAAD
jgi:hypothetical protein